MSPSLPAVEERDVKHDVGRVEDREGMTTRDAEISSHHTIADYMT